MKRAELDQFPFVSQRARLCWRSVRRCSLTPPHSSSLLPSSQRPKANCSTGAQIRRERTPPASGGPRAAHQARSSRRRVRAATAARQIIRPFLGCCALAPMGWPVAGVGGRAGVGRQNVGFPVRSGFHLDFLARTASHSLRSRSGGFPGPATARPATKSARPLPMRACTVQGRLIKDWARSSPRPEVLPKLWCRSGLGRCLRSADAGGNSLGGGLGRPLLAHRGESRCSGRFFRRHVLAGGIRLPLGLAFSLTLGPSCASPALRFSSCFQLSRIARNLAGPA